MGRLVRGGCNNARKNPLALTSRSLVRIGSVRLFLYGRAACDIRHTVHTNSLSTRTGIRIWSSKRRDAGPRPSAGATPPTHRFSGRYRTISRPFLPYATRTGRMSVSRPTPSGSCVPTSNAASWLMVLRAPPVRNAAMIFPSRTTDSGPHRRVIHAAEDCSGARSPALGGGLQGPLSRRTTLRQRQSFLLHGSRELPFPRAKKPFPDTSLPSHCPPNAPSRLARGAARF
jgi:hypothetical protein